MLKNRNLLIVALVVVVNAIGYGITIPIQYAYSTKFGLNDFQIGLFFALFSLCQFIATPVIGRLSDKFGRKPLLIGSIAGTAISFFMMAFAPNAIVLYLARALDGITAGNLPVASAVISDTTKPEDRAQGFGILGASFSLGFILGPAIAGVTVGYGAMVPLVLAGIITSIAVLLTFWLLPETNKHIGKITSPGKLFDFPKLFRALFDENVGKTLTVQLLFATAFGLFIYAFQPFAAKVLGMSEVDTSVAFVIFGIIGLINQLFLMRFIVKKWGEKRAFTMSLLISAVAFFGMYVTNSTPVFYIVASMLSFGNSITNPLIQTFLSKEADASSQGSIMGINASFMSIGFIIGPIIGGLLATIALPLPFLLGGLFVLACFALSFQILRKAHPSAVHI